ncbi:MAG: YdbL family protein [Geminicoccaceae bacterium]
MRMMVLVAAIAALFSLSTPVFADALDDARASGELGERIDGYLGVPPEASGSARALADEINAKRRQSYAEIAQKRDVPVEAVAAIAGGKMIEKAEAGEWIMDRDGWHRK